MIGEVYAFLHCFVIYTLKGFIVRKKASILRLKLSPYIFKTTHCFIQLTRPSTKLDNTSLSACAYIARERLKYNR